MDSQTRRPYRVYAQEESNHHLSLTTIETVDASRMSVEYPDLANVGALSEKARATPTVQNSHELRTDSDFGEIADTPYAHTLNHGPCTASSVSTLCIFLTLWCLSDLASHPPEKI